MAQTKISGLTAGSEMNTTDLFEIERADGGSRKLTAAQIATYVNAILQAGASADMNTFAEVEAALALKGMDGANPLTPPFVYDDFQTASTESGENGQLNWGHTNGTFNLANPDANHPGICRRTSTAVADVIASTFPGGGGTSVVLRFDQIDEQIWIIKPGSTDADYDLRLGFMVDLTSAPPSSGFYFERLAADANWYGVTRHSAAQTRTAALAPFAADWIKLKLRRIDAATVGFSVNNGAEVTLTTPIPTAGSFHAFGFHIIPRSANARSLDIDFYSHRLLAQTR